jgi:Leucine-rich repeat (LRR) protein
LKGTLPPEIRLLTGMVMFVVAQMELRGPVEGLFEAWSNIREIHLEGNQLTGKIPAFALAQNPFLETLELGENSFTGAIPVSLGTLENLTTLRLGDNSLDGQIPPSLGDLASLGKSLPLPTFSIPSPFLLSHRAAFLQQRWNYNTIC